jgi:hypothetical protein
MERQFDANKITHTRVPAVTKYEALGLVKRGDVVLQSGAKTPTQFVDDTYDIYKRHSSDIYTWGEIACTLSHIRAMHLALSDNVPIAVVGEDDLLLRPDTFTSIDEMVAHAPPDWSMIQIHTINDAVYKQSCPTSKPFVPWNWHHWSTGAYLITRAGMLGVTRWFQRQHFMALEPPLVADRVLFSVVRSISNGGVYTFARQIMLPSGHKSMIQSPTVADKLDTTARRVKERTGCAELSFERYPLRRKAPVFVGTVVKHLTETGVGLMSRNARALNASVGAAWGVLVLAADDEWALDRGKTTRRMARTRTGRLLNGAVSAVVLSSPSGQPTRSKLWCQLHIISIAAPAESTLLMLVDDDIDLRPLPPFPELMRTWEIAGRPLVSQPLVCGKCPQWYPMVNLPHWHAADVQSDFNSSIAVSVPVVEMQATILDLDFVRWLSKDFRVSMLLEAQAGADSDWGHDRLWCRGAEAYAAKLSSKGAADPLTRGTNPLSSISSRITEGVNSQSSPVTRRAACMVLLNAFVLHNQGSSLAKDRSYYKVGVHMLEDLQHHPWFVPDASVLQRAPSEKEAFVRGSNDLSSRPLPALCATTPVSCQDEVGSPSKGGDVMSAEMGMPTCGADGSGILGTHGVPACCSKECGECGGKGCQKRPGGEDQCCALAIRRRQRSCETHPPPCTPSRHGSTNASQRFSAVDAQSAIAAGDAQRWYAEGQRRSHVLNTSRGKRLATTAGGDSCKQMAASFRKHVFVHTFLSAISHHLFPSFMDHYHASLGVALPHFLVRLHQSRLSDVDAAAAQTLATYNVSIRHYTGHPRCWVGEPLKSVTAWARSLPETSWIVHADVDEHFEFPCEVTFALVERSTHNALALCATMLERVSPDMVLRPEEPSASAMKSRFSLCTSVRGFWRSSWLTKVILVANKLAPVWTSSHSIQTAIGPVGGTGPGRGTRGCLHVGNFSHFSYTASASKLLQVKEQCKGEVGNWPKTQYGMEQALLDRTKSPVTFTAAAAIRLRRAAVPCSLTHVSRDSRAIGSGTRTRRCRTTSASTSHPKQARWGS